MGGTDVVPHSIESFDVADFVDAYAVGGLLVEQCPARAVVDGVVDTEAVDAELFDGIDHVVGDVSACFGYGQIEHAPRAFFGYDDPFGMLDGHESARADPLGFDPPEEFHVVLMGGVADGTDTSWEAFCIEAAEERTDIVADGGESVFAVVGVEPEELEAEVFCRLEVRENDGLCAVVGFVEGGAQVSNGGRDVLAVDLRHHVSEHGLTKEVVGAIKVLTGPVQLKDSWGADGFTGTELEVRDGGRMVSPGRC